MWRKVFSVLQTSLVLMEMQLTNKLIWSIRGSYQTIWIPLLRASNDILKLTMTPSIQPITPPNQVLLNLAFYWIRRGFHIAFATVDAYEYWPLTPYDIWYRPIWDITYTIFVEANPFLNLVVITRPFSSLCPKSPSERGLVACLPVRLLFKSTKHNAFYPV